MRALVNYEKGKKKVRLIDLPVPEPGDGQVRVQVAYAGICGTDIHIYLDDGGYPTKPPVILGHEFSGVIDAVGEGVDANLIGKRVISESYFYTCGSCIYCQTGHKNLCPEKNSIGSAVNGAIADYVVVPQKNIHIIPDHVSLQEASMTEPLACCAQAVLGSAQIVPGDSVLITGPGPIGLMCLQFASLCGGKVIVAGTKRDRDRLQTALDLGATDIVYTDSEDAAAQLKEMTLPHGSDVVLDCSGAGPAINFGLESVRKGGRFVQVGLTGRPVTLDMNLITLKELRILGSYAQNTEWFIRSLELLKQGKLNVQALITPPYELKDWENAFQGHMSGEGYKYIIKIHED